MGSAQVQGPLWGAKADEWSELTEPGQVPFYEAVFDALAIGPSTQLLDVGCGAGLAMQLATKRSATVSGLDASEGLIAVARRRNPDADIRLGELEELPFPDRVFTAATSFNAVQYATDPVAALRELRRVVTEGATVAVLTWGAPERCEMREVLSAIGGLLPPPPPGAGGPFALSAPGALEDLLDQAGLSVDLVGEVDNPYTYPDVATAVRAQSASGPAVRAATEAGEEALHAALTEVMQRYHRDAEVRLENVFRYVLARA